MSDPSSNQRRKGRRMPHQRQRAQRPVDESPADGQRVERALSRSLEAAEGGTSSQEILLVRPVDLALLTPKQLRPQLDELLCAPHADAGLDSLLATGLLECLLPEVDQLVGFGDEEWRHKDVWKHTKQVVIQARSTVELRWAALMHDIGKVRTRSVTDDGQIHFHGHAEVGARMFNRLERRLALFADEQALRQEVHFLILHHLRASCYDGSWTDSAVRRFAREVGTSMENLFALSQADMTTKRPEKKRRAIRRLEELQARIAELAIEDARIPPLPKGLGTLLIAEFKLPPSKIVGNLIKALEAACEAGEIEGQQSGDYYVDYVAKNRERFGLG